MDDLSENITPERVRERWDQVVEMEGGDFPTSNQGATMDLVGKMEKLTSNPGPQIQGQGGLVSKRPFSCDPSWMFGNFEHKEAPLSVGFNLSIFGDKWNRLPYF